MTETLTDICQRLEHYETPKWAAQAIMKKEIFTSMVIDPCCGAGVLSDVAWAKGHSVYSQDIHDYGYHRQHVVKDFLANDNKSLENATVFMNPPFSLATQFVEKAFEFKARKVVCFQRFAWFESAKRREFWAKYPPNRIYICADRADCWRYDIPINDKGKRYDPITGKTMEGSPTAHAWFVWERDQPAGILLGHISKSDLD